MGHQKKKSVRDPLGSSEKMGFLLSQNWALKYVLLVIMPWNRIDIVFL